MGTPNSSRGDEDAASADAEPIRWAIAIHGGAGGNPEDWEEEKRSARLAGLRSALEIGRKILAEGGNSLDAVEQVIRSLEDDASFNAGRGAVLTTDGKAELDASIMDGETLACGGVAGVTRAKNPVSLARLVMEQTPHVLLVAEGADLFAKQQDVELVEPNYFLSYRKAARNLDVAPEAEPHGPKPHFGTVGCVALDQSGNIAAGTSTGGTSKKLPGRVGDSPIVGAGTYAANGLCGVSGTGRGEEFIRRAIAYDIAAQIRYADQSLVTAVTDNIRDRLEPGTGGLIAVGADGAVVMQHNTPGMSCAAADSRGRFEVQLVLDNGGMPASAENRSGR